MTSKKAFIAMAILVAATTFIACGGGGDGGPTGPTMTTVVGNFAISEAKLTQGGTTSTLTPPAVTGNLNLMADGSFTVEINFPGAGVSVSERGTYTVNGSLLTLNYDDGTAERATISDNSNRIVFSGTEDGATVSVTFIR